MSNNIEIMRKYDGRFMYVQDRSQVLIVIDTSNGSVPEKGGLYLWKMGFAFLRSYDVDKEHKLKIIGVDFIDGT